MFLNPILGKILLTISEALHFSESQSLSNLQISENQSLTRLIDFKFQNHFHLKHTFRGPALENSKLEKMEESDQNTRIIQASRDKFTSSLQDSLLTQLSSK